MISAGKAIRRGFGWARALRFRLAFSYVMFFAVLLVLLGILFRQTLSNTFQNQMESVLDEEWGAAKGYLRTGPEGPNWFYDEKDPDESFIVRRLQRVYMLADTAGHPLQHSAIYDSLGIDSPAEIRSILQSGQPALRVRTDPGNVPYMIRSGLWVDHDGHKYYLAIGRAIDYNDEVIKDFTFKYFALVPVLLVVSGVLGWFLAGRALQPVNSVADAAQRITHSNLGLQIPARNSGDELDRLIEAFNHMMSRLNESFEQIRQFSTDVSHELRTPLTVVRGQLEVALFTAQTVEQHRDAMADALEGVERLSNIVRALLMLSQAESGQLVLQKQEVDLTGLVRDLVDQHQIPAEAQGVHLSAQLPAGCGILGDRIQIERLVSNLLGNAIKYTPSGGRVKASLVRRYDHVELVVEDTGVGIAAEHLPHIFDRFYRVPSADPEKGLGLGLSFVAWIAKAHGGSVSVESKLNQGTRFAVTCRPATGRRKLPRPPACRCPNGYTRKTRMANLEIQSREREGIKILDVIGKLTVGGASDLRERVNAETAAGNLQQILNLKEVEYIDSTGLGAMVICYMSVQKAGGTLKLSNLNRRNLELVLLTKLSTVFQIFPEEQEAVNSFFPDREIKRFDILSFVQQQREGN